MLNFFRKLEQHEVKKKIVYVVSRYRINKYINLISNVQINKLRLIKIEYIWLSLT